MPYDYGKSDMSDMDMNMKKKKADLDIKPYSDAHHLGEDSWTKALAGAEKECESATNKYRQSPGGKL